MKKTIFLTGMPRANTTLLANILTNNPRIGGGETSPMLEYIYGARANFSTTPEVKAALTEDIMYNSFINFCRQGIDGYAKSVTDKEIYLDKSRGWVHYAPLLWEIQPDAKIIVMVRDIRSVVSSFEKKWRDNPTILDRRDNPGQQQFITVNQRVDAFLNDPPLGIALKRIYNALTTRTLDNMLVVHAEELAKNPKSTMEKIYEFIGEPYYDLDYNNIQQMTVENDRIADFGIYGDHKIRNKVEPLIKDYKEILGPEISNHIKSNFKWFYDAFGYF
jgi:sulfotransferase